jgi:SAM-dependent methyltransferase
MRYGGDDYRNKLDPDFPLQPRPAALLPPERDVHILDVGAGPLTYLGKKASGKQLRITAVDPLADEYDKILHKYGVQPLIRTQRLEAEGLTKRFSSNTFDLCVACNCLDHSYNPERAVLQMIDVVKKGRYVLLEHFRNEGERQNYSGLHQWNFDLSPVGDFLIRSKSSVTNMTQKYADQCTIYCELIDDYWLVTRILKK